MNNIRKIQKQKGRTRKELFKKSEIHYKKITDYENNYIKIENVTIRNLKCIAKSLEYTIDNLIS